MNITAIAAAALALMAAGSASAGERLTDSEYLKANRCRALAASETLGPIDTAAVDALLKDQSRSRAGAVATLAQDEQLRAKRQAQSIDRKASLQAELNGACLAYLQPAGAFGQP